MCISRAVSRARNPLDRSVRRACRISTRRARSKGTRDAPGRSPRAGKVARAALGAHSPPLGSHAGRRASNAGGRSCQDPWPPNCFANTQRPRAVHPWKLSTQARAQLGSPAKLCRGAILFMLLAPRSCAASRRCPIQRCFAALVDAAAAFPMAARRRRGLQHAGAMCDLVSDSRC